MTEEKTLTQKYTEINNALQQIQKAKTQKEFDKYNEIIKEHKYLFGIIANPKVCTPEELKLIPISLMDNIVSASRGSRLVHLRDLQEAIADEPEFLEQFNF